MLLLAAAFAIVQPGVVDQSLFSDSYRDIAGWSESLRATYIDALGLSAFNAQSFVLGHAVSSFSAPIALVEAMRPAAAHTPWLGRRALAVVALLYLVAALVLRAHLVTESSRASAAQVVGTLVVAGAFAVAAFAIGPKITHAARRPRTPRVRTVPVASFAAATLQAVAPDSWAGVALAAVVIAIGGLLLVRALRGADWSLAHVAAPAAGAVLSSGLLAFAYYPVVGEVSAARKYSHNVAMLLIVAAASGHAGARGLNSFPAVHLELEGVRGRVRRWGAAA